MLGSVADEDTCSELVQSCVNRFGGIDVMMNNAGIVRDRTLLKMSGSLAALWQSPRETFIEQRDEPFAMEQLEGYLASLQPQALCNRRR